MSKQVQKFEAGQRVNVTDGDDVFVGTVQKAIRGGRYRVAFDDESTGTYAASALEARKRGRKSLAETMTSDEIKGEVKGLLVELAEADNIDDKKRIRRALRRRGHYGGLGKKNTK